MYLDEDLRRRLLDLPPEDKDEARLLLGISPDGEPIAPTIRERDQLERAAHARYIVGLRALHENGRRMREAIGGEELDRLVEEARADYYG